jgi:hypothetical protein
MWRTPAAFTASRQYRDKTAGEYGSPASLLTTYSNAPAPIANAGKDTRNLVTAHSYRACVVVGVQPLRSQALLGAADGGLPQRFLYLPTSDPGAPTQRPADPGRWQVPTSAWRRGTPGHLRLVADATDLVVPEIALCAIDGHRLGVLRQDHRVDPLDGHALLCRLKAAAALMALDGRTALGDTDWQLAATLMEISTHTREQCRRALTDHTRRQNTARALAAVERDQVIAERKSQRARQAILRKLSGDQQLTTGELRRALKVDIRDHYDAALAELLESGEIVVSPGRCGTHRVPVYRRYTGQEPSSTSTNVACTSSTRVPDVVNR